MKTSFKRKYTVIIQEYNATETTRAIWIESDDTDKVIQIAMAEYCKMRNIESDEDLDDYLEVIAVYSGLLDEIML